MPLQIKQLTWSNSALPSSSWSIWEAQIADILRRTNQVIATIPGIGETLGAVILSEIGDIRRFETPAKLVAYAGLDVRVNQSGSSPVQEQTI